MHQEYEIHIDQIQTFTNPAGLTTFDVVMSSLANDEKLSIPDYKRWLWNQIKNGKGRQFGEIGHLARINQREEIVLLCFCPGEGCYLPVIVKAIRFHQQKYLLAAYEGIDEMLEDVRASLQVAE